MRLDQLPFRQFGEQCSLCEYLTEYLKEYLTEPVVTTAISSQQLRFKPIEQRILGSNSKFRASSAGRRHRLSRLSDIYTLQQVSVSVSFQFQQTEKQLKRIHRRTTAAIVTGYRCQ